MNTMWSPTAQLEHRGRPFVGGDYARLQERDVHGGVVVQHLGDLLEAEDGLAQVQGADESALALSGGDQAAIEEDVDGAPHGHGADPELAAQLRPR